MCAPVRFMHPGLDNSWVQPCSVPCAVVPVGGASVVWSPAGPKEGALGLLVSQSCGSWKGMESSAAHALSSPPPGWILSVHRAVMADPRECPDYECSAAAAVWGDLVCVPRGAPCPLQDVGYRFTTAALGDVCSCRTLDSSLCGGHFFKEWREKLLFKSFKLQNSRACLFFFLIF